MQGTRALGLGVVLVVLGSFFVILASPHAIQFNCLPDPCYYNSNYSTWGTPVEYTGLALIIVGTALMVLTLVRTNLANRKSASSP